MTQALLSPYLGVSAVGRDFLASVDSQMPPETRSFVPISHHGLVEEVTKNLTSGGMTVVQEVYGLSKNTQRMIGLLELVDETQSRDYSLIVGIRNSNDKSFPASLALGNYVHTTQSLAFSSEVLLARKHTTHILRDLPSLTSRAVANLMDARGKQARRIEAYQNREVTEEQAHDLIVRMFDKRVYPVTKLPTILTLWRHPKLFESRTLWNLSNAVTVALKPSGKDRGGSLFELPRRSQSMYGLLDIEVGLTGAPKTIFEALVDSPPPVIIT